MKASPEKAREIFSCDAHWRPLRFRDAFPFVETSPGVLHDEGTGLTWQLMGSEDPMSWRDALAYVDRLNVDSFAGTSSWRLPTVDELFTTLDPPLLSASQCVEPRFDRGKTCIWSCDRRSYVSAWYVDVELGFAAWADFSSLFFVRAVSGPE